MTERNGYHACVPTVWRFAVALLVLCLAMPAAATTQDFAKDLAAASAALKAYDRGDYDTALKWTRPAAVQGAAAAQTLLGYMYEHAQGVPQDYAAALKWYRLAAAQGYATAQYRLGGMYHDGDGVPQDYAAALKWYRLAAAQGNDAAQFSLGSMYEYAEGVPQDYAAALKWYRLAAAQGYAAAQLSLGLLYAQGHGVLQDSVEAHMWFNLAAALATNKNIRDLAEKSRDAVSARMTPADVNNAQRLAREWMAAFEKRQKK